MFPKHFLTISWQIEKGRNATLKSNKEQTEKKSEIWQILQVVVALMGTPV